MNKLWKRIIHAILGGPTVEIGRTQPRCDMGYFRAQLQRVKYLMIDEQWRTLQQISEATGDPEASVSARLRDLRKEKHGSYTVNLRQLANNKYEYQVTLPVTPEGFRVMEGQ